MYISVVISTILFICYHTEHVVIHVERRTLDQAWWPRMVFQLCNMNWLNVGFRYGASGGSRLRRIGNQWDISCSFFRGSSDQGQCFRIFFLVSLYWGFFESLRHCYWYRLLIKIVNPEVKQRGNHSNTLTTGVSLLQISSSSSAVSSKLSKLSSCAFYEVSIMIDNAGEDLYNIKLRVDKTYQSLLMIKWHQDIRIGGIDISPLSSGLSGAVTF